jgi:hypothetical protein
MNPTVVHPHLTNELMRNILADAEDVSAEYLEPHPAGKENYTHYVMTKDKLVKELNKSISGETAKKLTSYTTISLDVKYMLGSVILKAIDEIKHIDMLDLNKLPYVGLTEDQKRKFHASEQTEIATAIYNNKINYLIECSVNYNDSSVIAFIVSYIRRTTIAKKTILDSTNDPTGYFIGKFTQLLKEQLESQVHLLISDLYLKFIKCVAKDLNKFVWFNEASVNKKLLKSILVLKDVPVQILAEMEGSVPAK